MDSAAILTPCVSLRDVAILLRLLTAAFLTTLPSIAAVQSDDVIPSPAWTRVLIERLAEIQDGFPGELGVYVHDIDGGGSVSMRGDEVWYLASGVKVPVAIAVLRVVEEGDLALDSRLILASDDYVDGAGETNSHRPGTALRVDYLIEQMLIHSDNTATDVLIRHVGLDRVNAVARELMSESCGPITSLADVRRHVYGGLHERAFELKGNDLLQLKRAAAGPARVARLERLLGVRRVDFSLPDISSAFDAYYATQLNAAPLKDYGRMLIALAEGRALAPPATGYLLDLLGRVETGQRRIKAGLPEHVVFAHKTGTQHRRVCDFGLALVADPTGGRRVVITACSRGPVGLARSERALRAVGEAVAASGALGAPLIGRGSYE